MSEKREKQVYFGSKDELKYMPKKVKTNIEKEFDILKNYSFSRDKEVLKSDYCHIHYGDIHTKLPAQINEYTKIPYIDNSLKVDSNSLIKPNDLVVADASEDYRDLGKCIIIKDLNNKKVVAGLHTFHLRAKDKSIAAYFNYFTQTSSYKKQMSRLGTGTSVYGISKANISKIEFEKFSDSQTIVKCSMLLSQIDNLIINQEEKNAKNIL